MIGCFLGEVSQSFNGFMIFHTKLSEEFLIKLKICFKNCSIDSLRIKYKNRWERSGGQERKD